MPKQSLEFSGNLNAAAVADYLEDMARSLRQGYVSLESGADNVAFAVGGSISLELEAKANTEKGRSSIEIRLDWRKRKRSSEPPQALLIQSNGAKADAPNPETEPVVSAAAMPQQLEPAETPSAPPLDTLGQE